MIKKSKYFLIVFLPIAILCFINISYGANTHRFWPCTTAKGGGSGSMDGSISGVSIGPSDVAIVRDATYGYLVYEAKLDSATEQGIEIVRPDDVGAGVTSWHLIASGVSGFLKVYGGYLEADTYVQGGASKFYIYSGTTLTPDMLAGGMIFSHAAATIVLGIPASSGSTAFYGIWDMTGSGLTVQTTDAETIYDGSDEGTAYFVNAGNSRHSISFTANVESGSCTYTIVLSKTGDNWDIE